MGRPRRYVVALSALVVSAAVLAGAVLIRGDGDDRRDELLATERERVIDERTGVLHGIRFGDSAQVVRDRLGAESDDADGFFPKGTDYTGPPAITSPASDQRPPTPPTPLHFDDLAYLVSPTVGVFAMATLREGDETRAGVAVGDELATVREMYDGVSCGESPAGESLLGGETPTYPWCRAVVGDVRVFFGEDPIESITLTRRS